MIIEVDDNDFKFLDCDQAEDDLHSIEPDLCGNEKAYQELLIFVSRIKNFQRKYTKPIAALLKKDANG